MDRSHRYDQIWLRKELKMEKELLLEKLSKSRLSRILFFVVVAQNETEMSVACVSRLTKLINYSFTYDEKEDVLYNFSSTKTSFYSLKGFIETVSNILEEEDETE